jgi:Protein phosphatase 2C
MSDMSRDHPIALFCQEWTVQKTGLKPEQNEDACLTRNVDREGGVPQLLIAIADGATEAVYSRLWAKKLVEAARPDWTSLSDDDLGEIIKQICKEFSPIEPGQDVPWFVRNKYMDQGSQATLLAVTLAGLNDGDSLEVRAVSVGDCCLILFKASGEVLSFPMRSSDEFGVNPVLLGNRIPRPASYDRWQGRIEPGDMILIGTDAVSKWALQCLEESQSELLFDGLLGLLDQATSGLSHPVEISAPGSSISYVAAAPTENDISENVKDPENSLSLRGLLRYLWPWSNQEPPETTGSSDDQQTALEGAASQFDFDGEDVVSQTAQPAIEDPVLESSLRFEQFIQRYRAPQSELHMRNDDSTMVVCVPVRNRGGGQEREALEVIRGLQAAVAQRLQASQQMDEARQIERG